jgi:membrane protease YdiL (CAAX protease family)
VASVVATDYGNLGDAGGSLVAMLAVSTLFTGVSEELMFRGVALQAMRDRFRESRAAWLSSAMFGLLHLANVIVVGGAAVVQAFWAIGVGYLLYLCRRVGSGIVLPIVVHWLWDFSTFSPELGLEDAPVLSDLQFAMFLLSIALVVVVVIRRRAIPSAPPEASPVPDPTGEA